MTLISYDWPPATDTLVARCAHLAILTSLEPPVIAWELYYKLPKLSRSFPHVYLFGGAARRVASTTQFHPLQFPQVRVLQERDRRRLAAATVPGVDQQQQSYGPLLHALVRSASRGLGQARISQPPAIRRLAGTCTWSACAPPRTLRSAPTSIWSARAGSAATRPVPPELHAAVLPAYRGPVPEKLAVLAAYKFSLCFENSRFPGYVSEKIFDCFFTRTIPIYLGAPDIARYVPPQAFIDLTRFANYADARAYLDA